VLARFDKKLPRREVVVRESEGVGGKLVGECGEVCVRKKEAEGEKSVRHGTTGEGEGVKKVGSEQKGGAGKVRVGSVWVSVEEG